MNAPLAVIEIGSTGIRLMVAEATNNLNKKFNIIDKSEQAVKIGHDVFTTGSISRETLLSCIQILNRYSEQLKTWGIKIQETYVIATSAVREASNRDPFVDRIYVKTGYIVHVSDGIEENQLMYIAVTECIKAKSLSVQNSSSIIIEISGGSTELMLMENGHILSAHSLRMGTVIIEQRMREMFGSLDDGANYIGEFIRNIKNSLKTEVNIEKIKQFIGVNSDMKIAARAVGHEISPFLWEIKRKSFEDFVNEVTHLTVEECIIRFNLNYSDAQSMQISLLAYKMFLDFTKVQSILVPETSIREGVLLNRINKGDNEVSKDFSQQILASARALLKRYSGDQKHADFVMKTSLRLYDELEKELGLDSRAKNLLAVSSILHDIGMFIRPQNHNEHSKYIINNSDIFGLSREDKALVALITYFHRGNQEIQDDSEFKLLPRGNRMIVLKLSAILRVADALDRSHQQILNDFTIHFATDSMTIRAKGNKNLNMEKFAVAQKSDLFENIFGYKVVLV